MGGGSSARPFFDSSFSNEMIPETRKAVYTPEEILKSVPVQPVESKQENDHATLIISNPVDPALLRVPYINRYPFQDYRFMKKVGQGKLNCVYKAVHIKYSENEKYAVKEISVQQFTAQQYEDMSYEINILSQLNHPNILKLKEVYEPAAVNAKFYMVMEYLRGGELIPALITNESYSFLDILYYFQQIASAIQYLHSRGISYGNLVPENVVFENRYNPNNRMENRIKLVGFERAESMVSQFRRRPIEKEWKDATFSPPEMSFNLGKKKSKDDSSHFFPFGKSEKKQFVQLKQAVDVWQFGELFYVLLAGELPREKKNFTDKSDIGFHGGVWSELGNPAKAFFMKVLQTNPLYRPSINEVLADPWFSFDFKSIPSEVSIEDVVLQANIEGLQLLHRERLRFFSQILATKKVEFSKVGRFQEEQILATLLSINA